MHRGVLLTKDYTNKHGLLFKKGSMLTIIDFDVYQMNLVCSMGTPVYKEYINDFGYYEEWLNVLQKED